MMIIKRGEIYLTRFDEETIGSEVRDTRPALIISNDWQNEISRRVIVLPMTSNTRKVYEPIELVINQNSKVMCDQIKSIDKRRLIKLFGVLDNETMKKIDDIMIKLLNL